jgi:cell division protein FtsN
MTQDFKRKNTAYSPLNDAVSWVLASTALGLFVGLMFYLFSDTNSSVSSENFAYENSTEVIATANTKALLPEEKAQAQLDDQRGAYLDKVIEEKVINMAEDDRPRFNYHVILPILDVEVPVARPPKHEDSKKKITDKKASASQKKKIEKIALTQYILQVSSHKSEASARNTQARMKALGVKSNVKKVIIKGEQWYRVSVGPLNGAKEAAKTEDFLLSKGVKPFRRAFR